MEEWVGSLPGRSERKGQPAAKTWDSSTFAPSRGCCCYEGAPASPGVWLEGCRRAVSKAFIHVAASRQSIRWRLRLAFYTHLYPYPYTHPTTLKTGASLFRSTMSAKTVSPFSVSVRVESLPCLESSALQARMMTKERDGGRGETTKARGVVEGGPSVRWCV